MLSIVKKEVLQQIRDFKGLLLMTLMPILVIWVITLVFGNMFKGTIDFNAIKIGYLDPSQVLLWENKNIESIKYQDLDKGMDALANHEISGFVVDQKIYINNQYMKEGLLLSQLGRYTYEVRGTTTLVQKIYTHLQLYQTDVANYYGIAMLLLFALYNIPFHITSMIKEKNQETLFRILSTKLTRVEYIFGKIIGNFIVVTLEVSLVYAASILFFKVDWGNPFLLWLVLETYLLFLVGLGILLGALFNNENIAIGLIHVLIVIFAFFGGGYMPIYATKLTNYYGKFLSPLWWMVKGVMTKLYDHSNTGLVSAILFNLIGFLMVTSLSALWLYKGKGVRHE